MEDYLIVNNNEDITFDTYIKRLFELYRDCNREVYYAEILIPFLKMCSPRNAKIIPVYDDRNPGKLAESEELTDTRKRMNIICAPKGENKYVVPDYIYVSEEYSFRKPCKPYIMVETKLPIFLKDGEYYRALEDAINDSKDEIRAEIRACGTLIFTDGITWMFLCLNEKQEIVNELKPIKLVNFNGVTYYKTEGIEIKYDKFDIDLSFIDDSLRNIEVEVPPNEWDTLKRTIHELVYRKMVNTKVDLYSAQSKLVIS